MKYFLILLAIISLNCSKSEINKKIEIYDSSIESIIDIFSEIEILADSISLPEGPVWDKSSNSLLFVDIMNNKIHKWSELKGVSEYIYPSGNTGYAPNVNLGLLGANGLAIDNDGKIILCQHGDRRLASVENIATDNPNFQTIVDKYDGKRFNSPNDLVFSNDGSIYFTDPAFGFFDLEAFQFVESEFKKLDFNGVYKYNRSNNELELITDQIDLPNGIGISPDNKFIYVNKMGIIDSNPKVMKIDIETNELTTLFNGKDLSENHEGYFDGMIVHSSGNIFTSGPGGLLVISPVGKLMAKIDFGHITNVTFDDNENYLYVTGFANNPKVYRLKLKSK